MLTAELSEKILVKRNKQLLQFFTNNGYDVRLVGEKQKPSVILNEMVVLSCHVKQFDLIFTKEPFNSEIIKIFKLKDELVPSSREIQETIEMSTHRHIYKLKLVGHDMYVVGFNTKNSDAVIEKESYPVFGKHNPKVYFDREYIDKVAISLIKDGYNLDII